MGTTCCLAVVNYIIFCWCIVPHYYCLQLCLTLYVVRWCDVRTQPITLQRPVIMVIDRVDANIVRMRLLGCRAYNDYTSRQWSPCSVTPPTSTDVVVVSSVVRLINELNERYPRRNRTQTILSSFICLQKNALETRVKNDCEILGNNRYLPILPSSFDNKLIKENQKYDSFSSPRFLNDFIIIFQAWIFIFAIDENVT